MTSPAISDLGPNFVQRFEGLLKTASGNTQAQEPALVPAAGKESLMFCESVGGGKDVALVLVRTKSGADGKPMSVKETLTYRRDIAGSDLVYDLTGEFMQGKARPFDCDLRKLPARLYALLPFQIENLQVAAEQRGGTVTMAIEFQDAQRKRAEGPLPCHATLQSPTGKAIWERFLTSSKDGHLTATAELSKGAPQGKWRLVVRSLLDGKEITVPIEVGPSGGK